MNAAESIRRGEVLMGTAYRVDVLGSKIYELIGCVDSNDRRLSAAEPDHLRARIQLVEGWEKLRATMVAELEASNAGVHIMSLYRAHKQTAALISSVQNLTGETPGFGSSAVLVRQEAEIERRILEILTMLESLIFEPAG